MSVELAERTDGAYWFLANLAVVKVRGDQTGGAWDMVEITGTEGELPPLHVHHTHEETFVVIDGELTLLTPDGSSRVGPGEALVAPRGVPHVYRIESATARWHVISSPAGFASFVAEAGSPAEALTLPSGPPAISPEQVGAIAARHGIEILGPPGLLP
jgi:quercetin dioxygenase-like cupin family protein